MADDPNIIPRSAILQSITTEAGGFYTTVTTVASTFLGGSLIFLEKFAAVQNAVSITILAVAWAALIGSIGFVARVRYLNLKSGRLALRDEDSGADAIDLKTDKYSNWSQWLLLLGMVSLFVVGLMNVSFAGQKEEKTLSNGNLPTRVEKSIPYGSVKPATQPVTQMPSQVPVAPQQQPQNGGK